jgi:uncharacterized membrane protein
VSKGFYRGPWVPVHGIGGLAVYFALSPFAKWPLLVFLAGAAACTVLEYVTSVILEKCFGVRCWDYATYPYTKWCHYKGRICLTFFFIFGGISLFEVYFYWAFCMRIAQILEKYILALDGVLLALFLADVIFSCSKTLRLKRDGIKVTGWAMFTDTGEAQ